MALRESLRDVGKKDGALDRETMSIATFLVTDEPTDLMIEYIDGYIDGWLDYVERWQGAGTRFLIEQRWNASSGPKYGQRDMIEEIRIARRDHSWFSTKIWEEA